MKKIILSIFLVLSIVLTMASANALTATTCSASISIKYYTVPATITRSICVQNNNAIPVTVTFETSSNLGNIIQFSQNPVTLAVGEKKFVSFNANINQDSYVSGAITSIFRPAPGYQDNWPEISQQTTVTISKGACSNGQTQACTVDQCPGTQTCENYIWGTCMKTDPNCGGVCQENWQCSAWTTCTNNQQTRTCTEVNSCGTINNKPITFQACSGTCTESWSCTDWGACQSSNTQTRTCSDSNSCGTATSKPAESQGCTYNSGGGSSGGGSSGGGSSGGGSSGGGGGGGGGGSTYDSCKNRVWDCKPIGECVNGTQENLCKDVTPSGGCTTKKSDRKEIKNCTVEIEEEPVVNEPVVNNTSNSQAQQTNQTTNTNQENQETNEITGEATFVDKIKSINIFDASTTGGKVLILGLVSAAFIGIMVYFSIHKK